MDNISLDRIELSIGKHRRDTGWQRKTMSWAELAAKLTVTHRTAERYKEYIRTDKKRQDEIKDIGGFVGGVITGGRRLKRAVLYRTLLTLDIDNLNAEQGARFWKRFIRRYECAAVLYSTHKHSTDNPRLRLVVPFDRQVTVEEYPAIARRIAGDLGIDLFDPTTFQHERLMYWPSTAKDGLFYQEQQTGDALSADEVLAAYGDGQDGPGTGWQDMSQWPTAQREKAAIWTGGKLAGDPTEKKGLIGVFCRIYDIHAAIERFLPKLYERCAEDRYTYLHGSTSAGVIVYPYDRAVNGVAGDTGLVPACFAFSHHGSDPAGGRLVNAFDLVRLHKFGHLDMKAEGAAVDFVEEDGPVDVTKLASYKEMIEFVGLDPAVKQQVVRERNAEAEEAFKEFADTDRRIAQEAAEKGHSDTLYPDPVETLNDELPVPASRMAALETTDADDLPGGDDWTGKLECDKRGMPKSTIFNAFLILQHDPALSRRFMRDEFTGQDYITGQVPWRRVRQFDKWLTDTDLANLRGYLEKKYGLTGTSKVDDALEMVLTQRTTHPVRDYLRSLQWDGVARIEQLLQTYLGVEDSIYTRTCMRKWMAAAVTRVMRPGVKFEYVLVLVGDEGKKKSMLFDRLGMEWYSDNLYTVHGKEASEQVQGKWIVELSELDALKKAEDTSTKSFISRRVDSYRPAYGRRTVNRPRQCIFGGTTNELRFLKNKGGNRRFWPFLINVNRPIMDVASLNRETVGQLWAEAMELYRDGELLYLNDELTKAARAMQQAYTERDERQADVEAYLDLEVPGNWYELDIYARRDYARGGATAEGVEEDTTRFVRDRVCCKEIWTELFGGDLRTLDRRNSDAICNMLDQMEGWKRASSLRIKGMPGVQKGWLRKLTLGG